MLSPEMNERVNALRHLMSDDCGQGDFVFPTLLKEVPSITSPNTVYRGVDSEYGELGRRPKRDR